MPPGRLRLALLRIGYRLPSALQRAFHRSLYDGPRPGSGRLVVSARDDPPRLVRFEFTGGCRDGQIVEGAMANVFYWKSDHGRVGFRFRVPTEEAIDAVLAGKPTGPILDQEYEVVENRPIGGLTFVRAESRGVSG